ncbi:helix-turn-helix transcriptional regulator [Schleiferilactobacillus perolens]|jgi:transcriptional regulator with XRE-family HTH domain|uniref:helix-turn-helix transcriptional regulator n=2 Tax=Schleiferilactobacillus perolens TaxID=100468 RepID=UPI0023563962|nr:helix-turn-helix domain-containing protein [Schleiferilactobacillus perolens]MCI2169944.1 helix-turn-helix domain-containing protein [Schleiferilactobacillus perolens]
MEFPEQLRDQRRKAGLSQEEVAEKVGVTRQTVSKWETGQAVPELLKGKILADLFGLTYDQLLGHDITTNDPDWEQASDQIDWTSAWAKKYPILQDYQHMTKARIFSQEVSDLYDRVKKELGLSELDAFLVVKDMVYQRYRTCKRLAEK